MSKVETDTRAVPDSTMPALPAIPGAPVRSRWSGRGPIARVTASGFARIAGISASLVGTQLLTSVLGLVFWTLAARRFVPAEVGIAGAGIALMLLLGSLGSLGLGTVLIARLPSTEPRDRRVLVRTCVAAAATAGTVLGLIVPAVAVHVLGAVALAPIAGTVWPLLGLAAGTGLTSAVIVLDQAVLTIGVGSLQLERNVTASTVKIVALVALSLAGAESGMTILLAWTIGNAVSLPVVAWRTRGGRALAVGRRWVEPTALRGLGKQALSHHALNVSIQAALQLLPVLVTVLVSTQQNARFNAALMLAGFVFALPYAVSVGLFAAARGNESEVLDRMRLTIPFGLAVSAAADLVIFPLAEPMLHIFGASYAAGGAVLLRLVVLAGLPFVVKDHFIALRRVQGRTTEALAITTGFLVVELAAAAIGAEFAGAVGLCVGWLAVLAVEGVALSLPLLAAERHRRGGTPPKVSQQPGTAAGTATDAPADSGPAPVEPTPWFRRNLAGPTLLLMALGVLVMASAANAGRAGVQGALPQAGWVAGLVLVFLPAALRVLAAATPSAERVVVAVGLGLMLQFSRLLLNPTIFAFHDELIHAETLRQIEATGHLFTANPLLPVSSYYPGLEVVTDGVQALTGLPSFAAAAGTLLLARLIIVLAILGLTALITSSLRAGAVAVLVYLTNPQLLFFNSQYSYQTLALPLAVLSLYFVATRRQRRRSALVLPLASTAAVAVTHHLTALLLVVAYAVWVALVLVRGNRTPSGASAGNVADRHHSVRGDRIALAVLTLWGALVFGLTVLVPGNPLRSYLEAILGSSTADLAGLSEGHQTKALFADTAGSGPAPWERVLLIAAVLLATASLLVALGFVRSNWRRARPLALLLGLVALLYPVIPGGHLTRATAEVGDRAAGFVFLGTAVVLGAWWWQRRRRAWTGALFALACTVLFLGDVVLGAGPTAGQLPGPYQVSADARSVDAANLAAAHWLAVGVPRGGVVYGDRTSGLLAAAYGDQTTVLHVSTGIDASRLLLAPTFTSQDRALIRAAKLDYLIVDQRLATGLPHQQFYIESGEFGGGDRTAPVTTGALAKFGSVPGVERLYDNGSLVIYDVRGLR